MRGLILKDLYTLKSFARSYGLIFGGMMVWSAFMENPTFLLAYAVILGSMLVLSSMSMDESVSFNRYAMTMPINTRMLVKAKYMLFLITTLGGITLGLLFNGIMSMTMWRERQLAGELLGVIAIIVVCIVSNSIALPIMFKFGSEKARYAYILVIIGMTLLAVIVEKIHEEMKFSPVVIDEKAEIWLAIAMLGVCILAVFLSYKVTLKVVEKKEW